MGTENPRFRQGSKREVWEINGFGFRKCPRGFLGFFLHFKRYRILPTWVYFPFLGWKWSNVRVPVKSPYSRRVELCLGEDTESPGKRSLHLGEGGVCLGEGVHLGEGMHA